MMTAAAFGGDQSWSNPEDVKHIFMDMVPAYVRPEKFFTVEEVSNIADDHRKSLFDKWDSLGSIMAIHETSIRKRWIKRTQTKRRSLLKELGIPIPDRHAPEVDLFEKLSRGGARGGQLSDARDAFLSPFLNAEDLTSGNGENLLGLLHYRSHLLPSEFSQFDLECLNFGIVSGAIKRVYAPDCTMIGIGGRESYGQVLRNDCALHPGGPDGFTLEWTYGAGMQISDGLCVLEAQVKLTLTSRQYRHLCLPGNVDDMIDLLSELSLPQEWSSFAKKHSLRAYSLPPRFLSSDLAVITSAQYEIVKDHLIDLRTDPMYLAEQLALHVDHLTGSSPKEAPLIVTSLLGGRFWDITHTLVQEIISEEQKLKLPLPRDQDLPLTYGSYRAKAEHRYRTTLCGSPSLRRYFQVHWKVSGSSLTQHKIRGTLPKGDRVVHILKILLDTNQTHLWQVSRVFDELDRAVANNPEHVSPLLADVLFDYGSCTDILETIDRHRPLIVEEQEEDTIERLGWRWFRLEELQRFEGQVLSLHRVAFPISKFVLPKGPKTEEWAVKCEKVDASFAEFWKTADGLIRSKYGNVLFAFAEDICAQIRKKIARSAPSISTKMDRAIPFGGAEQRSASPTPIPTVPKTKVKTIGKPLIRHTLKVSKRVFSAFASIFRTADNSDVHSQQTSLAWKEVLHAFAAINFRGTQLHGSVWRFEHPDGRNINFHSPHPSPKYTFWQLRRMGRRLTRRLGWSAETFVLA
ncbi:uncharacterized protein EV420DRAFT_1521647 [Desarmillaria tabescens]|uniref:Uncharacterized protein n=1 Tax=Armillaria tabescens TaxID=1929756 RepID=A0AA39NC52_ARMTA|nr:uncharacterized protein EV420DRAFT_1521647 [Desarmillaria tabescens]KAK0462925.1 hypothetical protein EV420DRAFT_1521647 [Desarmillaria tabescens]